jgi:DNA-binding NtrC family response regulator
MLGAMMNERNNLNVAPRILVVDDEGTIRYMLRTFLEMKGCEVTEAGSGEEALQLLPEARPDVALIDIVLPGKNGVEVLSDVKQQSPNTEVVLITSHGSEETAIEAIRRGAYDYLQKPFPQLEDVWLTVMRALEKRNLSLQVRGLVAERAFRAREISSTADQTTPEDVREVPESEQSAEDRVPMAASKPDRK